MIEILSGGRGIGKTQKTLEFVVKKYNEANAENKRLKEAIEKAREQIDELDGEYLTIYDGTNKLGSGKYVYIEEVLEILDKLIESEE